MRLPRLIVILVTLTLILSVVFAGCAQPTPSPSPTPAPSPSPSPSVKPSPSPTPTQDSAAAFYKNKLIRFDQMFAAGSGEDLAVRAMAPYIVQQTGASGFDITNRTGAGGVDAVNHVYAAKNDALTLGMGNLPVMAISTIFDRDPAVKFNTEEFAYLMGFPLARQFFVVKQGGPYDTIEKLQAASNLRVGMYAALDNFVLPVVTAMEAFGLKGKIISGVGGGKRMLMLEREELDCTILDIDRIRQAKESGAPLKPLFVVAPERLAEFPDIPTLRETLATKPTGDLLSMIELSENVMPRIMVIIAPPGVSEDKLKFLEAALLKAGEDGKPLIENALEMKVDKYITRAELNAMIKDLLTPASQAKFKSLFEPVLSKYGA